MLCCGRSLTIASLSASPFDPCTRQGVGSGTALTGYPINNTYTLAASECVTNADCNTAAGFECRMPGSIQTICYCEAATGRDACTPVGTCALTPLQACQNCLDIVNPIIKVELNATSPSRTAACAEAATKGQGVCTGITDKFLTVKEGVTGNFGLRAAALCSALGKCAKLPEGSMLRSDVAGTNRTGVLDLCTAEGIVGGSAVFQGRDGQH